MLFSFHLVEIRPWPIFMGGNLLRIILFFCFWLKRGNFLPMFISLLASSVTIVFWWRDVIRESLIQGHHTKRVVQGLKGGFILFIVSEVIFFFRFFWRFFEYSLSPQIDLGGFWPPEGSQETLAVLGVPLVNTIVLLTRGILLTLRHHSLISMKKKERVQILLLTVFYGVLFTLIQVNEYGNTSFRIRDSVFGTTFFVITGFHGLHVLLGRIILLVRLYRLLKIHFIRQHHVGIERAAWYWHFVDVVWIFLFMFVYAWALFRGRLIKAIGPITLRWLFPLKVS